MKYCLKWISEWLYDYRKETISIGMIYGHSGSRNTYHFHLHNANVSQFDFNNEHDALKAGIVKIDELNALTTLNL